MPILKNQRHEILVPGISRGLSGKQAYLKAYSNAGNSSAAEQSAARLLRSVKVRARIGELPERIAAKTVKLAVCERRAQEERTERRDLSLKAMGSASDGEWAALLASIDG